MVADNVKEGSIAGFDQSEGVAIGKRMADTLGLVLGDMVTLISPEGDVTPMGHDAAREGLSGRRDLRSGHVGI